MTDNEAMRETLNKLIAAVESNEFDKGLPKEYTTLGRLAVRAGLMWRCHNPSCFGLNHLNCMKCDNCGCRKAKVREIPQPERL